jgi:hypothetical protein
LPFHQDLIELRGLYVAAKFTNANILTSGAGREKWQQARAEVLGNPPANETDAQDSTERCLSSGGTSDWESPRVSAKKK